MMRGLTRWEFEVRIRGSLLYKVDPQRVLLINDLLIQFLGCKSANTLMISYPCQESISIKPLMFEQATFLKDRLKEHLACWNVQIEVIVVDHSKRIFTKDEHQSSLKNQTEFHQFDKTTLKHTMSKKLYLSGLPDEVTHSKLRSIFLQFGRVKKVFISDKFKRGNFSYGFVVFCEKKGAQNALDQAKVFVKDRWVSIRLTKHSSEYPNRATSQRHPNTYKASLKQLESPYFNEGGRIAASTILEESLQHPLRIYRLLTNIELRHFNLGSITRMNKMGCLDQDLGK